MLRLILSLRKIGGVSSDTNYLPLIQPTITKVSYPQTLLASHMLIFNNKVWVFFS